MPGKQPFQIPLQTGPATFVQARLHLRHRQHRNFFHVFRPTLGNRVKVPHGIQLVAKKLRPHRPVFRRRVQVQDTAPERKLAGPLHHGRAAVAHGNQAGQKSLHIGLHFQAQREGGRKQGPAGHGPEAQGFPGKNLQPCFSPPQIIQLPQSALLPNPGGRSRVIQIQLPARQHRRFLSQKGFQFALHPPGRQIVRAEHRQGPVAQAVESGNDMGPVDLRQACRGGSLTGTGRIQKLPEFRQLLQGLQQ